MNPEYEKYIPFYKAYPDTFKPTYKDYVSFVTRKKKKNTKKRK